MQTIQARDYVWRKGNALVPAWMAFAVVRLLEQHFGHLVDYGFTATMEEALDVIARGEGEAEKWLHSFYFGNGTAGLRELVGDENLARIDPREISTIPIGVTDDGTPVVVRVGRYGPYVQVGEEGDRGLDPARPRARRAHRSRSRSSWRASSRRARRRSAPTPRPTSPSSCSTAASARTCSSARDQRQQGEATARVAVQVDAARDGHARAGAHAALAARASSAPPTTARRSSRSTVATGPTSRRAPTPAASTAEEKLLTLTREEALAILATPKTRGGRAAKPPIAELGESPDTGTPIRVLEGRFGAYCTDGTTNATVPARHRPRGRDAAGSDRAAPGPRRGGAVEAGEEEGAGEEEESAREEEGGQGQEARQEGDQGDDGDEAGDSDGDEPAAGAIDAESE